MNIASIKARAVFAALIAFVVGGVGAQAHLMQTSYAAVGAATSVPYGWVDFCGRRPEECNAPRLPAADLKLSTQTWALLDRINREVNAAIEPISNLDHWGTTLDHWDYPVDGKGDCKIYALYKRKLLLDEGFPR
jgi:predicted transglutaminase-like cysteine proteinase